MSNLPVAQINKADLLSKINALLPEMEAGYLSAVLNKDIVALGTDEVFALRDGDGQIRAFKQALTLSLANGGLVQPVSGGPCVVSAQGYEMWQETVGASVIFPREVLVEDRWMPNPAIVRDPANRRILCVHARAIAFRFSAKGIPLVSDWTVIFDNPSYRMIDLLAKAKKYQQAFRLLPAEMGKPEEPGTWASYPFDESTNLWINTAHEESLSWYSTIINREKKSIDFAQTFAKRNALKHLSGIQKVPGQERTENVKVPAKGDKKAYEFTKNIVTPIESWTFPVLCWRPTGNNIIKWDATQYAQIQDKATRFIESKGADFASSDDPIDVSPKNIHVTTGREQIGDEAAEMISEMLNPEDVIEENLESSTDPEPPASKNNSRASGKITPDTAPPTEPGPPVTPSVMETSLSDEDKKLMANLEVTKTEFPVEFKKACMMLKIGFGDDTEYTVEEAAVIMKKVNELVDQF